MTRGGLEERIREVIALAGALDGDESAYLARQELEFEKWRLIHKHVHANPFATRARLARSAQWRDAANQIRDLGEIELLDWTLLQAEVAHNLERGVRDMRPRKNGPCHGLILEYVANRKRKALAVLHFLKASEAQGVYKVNSAFHARTQELLGGPGPGDDPGDGGHEAVPWAKPEDDA